MSEDIEDVYSNLTGQIRLHGREVVYGDQIIFDVWIRDANEDLADPVELYFQVFRSQMRPAFERLDIDDIEQVDTGQYRVAFDVPEYLVPGQYIAQWEFTDDENYSYARETFFVIDPPVSAMDLLDPPRTVGSIIEDKTYLDMGRGDTDTLVLIGHADGLTLNDPYHVGDMQEAINVLQADLDSPLLRALLEAYNGGARDIYLVAAAPMREYITTLPTRFDENEAWGGATFYERYAARLEYTYQILREYDTFDVIVPLEAPFYDAGGVDFYTPLVQLCADILTNTSNPPVGVIGTRYDTITDEQITENTEDPRLTAIHEDAALSAGGKMVIAAFGEVIVQQPFLPNVISGSANVAVGTYLASSSLSRGVSYSLLPNLQNIKGTHFTQDQITRLANARLNPVIKNSRGKRGAPFNVCLATDATQAPEGSDYWSVVQMRLVARVVRDVRNLGKQFIGTTEYALLKERVKIYFATLQRADYVRDYTFNIQHVAVTGQVTIDIILWPRLGINDIRFAVRVGPNAQSTAITQYNLGEDYVFTPELSALMGI